MNDEYVQYVFPISDSAFVLFHFDITRGASDTSSEMDKLVDKIIDSVDIQLSDSAKASIEEIKKTVDPWALPEEFPPLNWPVKLEDVENVSDNVAELPK